MRTPSLALVSVFLAGLLSGAASAQTTHEVTTVGTMFSPADVTILEGDTVLWTSLQPAGHTVTETDCPPTPASVYNGGFRSGFPNEVSTFSLTFETAETFCYICETHVGLSMFGTVTVCFAPDTVCDGVINILDVQRVLNAFGRSDGEAGYDPALDLVADGTINILDVQSVLNHFGEKAPFEN